MVEVEGFTRFGAFDGKEHVAPGCPRGARAPLRLFSTAMNQQRIAEPPLRTAAIGITLIGKSSLTYRLY
jgi:hypothetical protein